MRAILFATTLLLLPMAAHAQVTTNSPAEDLALAKSYLQDLKAYILQQTSVFHEAATDLQTAEIYAQELQTYIAFVEDPSLANAMGILGRLGLSNDLPVNPMQVMSLSNGFNSMENNGSLMGALAGLRTINGYAQGAFGTNHIYTCNATDQACTDLNARANGIAGSMGLTQAAYQDIQAHLATIQALRNDLAGETTPAKRETIQAQLMTEQVWMANMQASLASAGQQAALQQQSFEQRDLERQRSAADALFDSTHPITSVPATTNQPAAIPPLFSAN